jgi:hypothetical protein
MANIGLVDVGNLTDGSVNVTAKKMSKLRAKVTDVKGVMNATDHKLANLGSNLPESIPSTAELQSNLDGIHSNVRAATAIVTDTTALLGSCADGAVEALLSLQKDAFGMIDGFIDALDDLAGITSDMVDISGAFGAASSWINKLGISDLIADIYGGLGCLGEDNPLIADVTNELAGIQSDLGLSPTGAEDPSAYKAMMGEKIQSVSGIGGSSLSSVTDALNTIAVSSSAMASEAEQSMDSAITTVKNGVPKITPPTVW